MITSETEITLLVRTPEHPEGEEIELHLGEVAELQGVQFKWVRIWGTLCRQLKLSCTEKQDCARLMGVEA